MEEPSGLLELVIAKTRRVPLPAGPAGEGSAAARQLDAALLAAGWKLSGGLLLALSGLDAAVVGDLGVRVLAVARHEAGDHVRHNAYFRDFPRNVPGTTEFWLRCIREALAVPETAGRVAVQLAAGSVNLLDLPAYGTYQHTWEELIAAHGALIPAASDRLTVLHEGGGLADEARALYLALAGGSVPLSDDDTAALATLALACASGPQPEAIPVRESRAVINRVRLAAGAPLLADTVTDVLRLAAAASGGDVSLQEPARLRSFSRPERRALLAALDAVIAAAPAKLGDVGARAERWKRLGERLHPHEHPRFPHAAMVFEVARGERRAPSLAARVEAAFAAGDTLAAARLLSAAPGQFFRAADRLLRTAADQAPILELAAECAPLASCRVLLSLREHLGNRGRPTDVSRVYANRAGRAQAAADTREPLPAPAVEALIGMLDASIASRLPDDLPVVIDPGMLQVALPLSGKAAPGGLGVLPRGSVTEIAGGEILRFFCYWREAAKRTDYDLSAVMLDSDYGNAEHVSWTSYHAGGYATYSGDLTEAPEGATEFVDIVLGRVPRTFVLPQVHLYAGEPFGDAAEAFFGYMTRTAAQEGVPFEPRTVRVKSDLRGAGRIALPVAFMRGEDGTWRAKWLHLYLPGRAGFNQSEGSRETASTLTRAVVERDYLRVSYLAELLRGRGVAVTTWDGGELPGPVMFIGMESPPELPEGSRAITPLNLADLIPK